jgi:MFS family permease
MRKLAWLILFIFVAAIIGVAIAYGNDLWDTRARINGFFAMANPAVYGAFMGVAGTIASNSWYQLLHPLLWVFGGVLLFYFGHQAWNSFKQKIGIKPAQPQNLGTVTLQREPAEPERVIPKKEEKPREVPT